MKIITSALILLSSTSSFAGLKCLEPDSTLYFGQNKKGDYTVSYVPKASTVAPTSFKGVPLPKTSATYFKVQSYALKSTDGQEGSLKISTIPIMTRLPPCRGRVCHADMPKYDVSAELDFQGKVTSYDCQQVF